MTAKPDTAYFSSQELAPGTLPPPSLPTYQAGDKFYYSNGWKEEVVETQGGQVTLLNKADRKIVYLQNFVIPAPYIEGSKAEYRRDSLVSPNALWPLTPGNSVRFSTDSKTYSKETGQRSSAYRQIWDCNVEGQEHVNVLAGEFDTHVVTCRHYSTSGSWIKRYTWYYAPELNTYVLRHYFNRSGKERVRELTALRPSLSDVSDQHRRQIVLAWQDALENAKRGEFRSWSSADGNTRVKVHPLKTFKANNGQYCRTYRQELTRNGHQRLYAGVACREGKLQWKTPQRG